MEFWFDTTSEDDPFVGFEDPLSYTWLETSGDPLDWATQHEDLAASGHSNALQMSTITAKSGLTNPEAVENWLQRTESSSQLSDRATTIDGSTETTDQDGISRNTSNSSLQSMASSANSFSKRGRRITNGYPCDKCGDLFDLPSELRHHGKNHMSNEERPFGCTGCGQRFIWPKDLKRHMRRKHPEMSEYLEVPGFSNHRRHPKDHPAPDSCTSEVKVQLDVGMDSFHLSSFESEERLMLPKKKRKASFCLQEDSPAQDGAHGGPIAKAASIGPLPLETPAEKTTVDESVRQPLFQHSNLDKTLMNRKQRTKVWLESTKALLREAKDLPGPLLDIFLHSLETMAREIDRLETDEVGNVVGKDEARAALSAVTEYFRQPNVAVASHEEETLTRLMNRLEV